MRIFGILLILLICFSCSKKEAIDTVEVSFSFDEESKAHFLNADKFLDIDPAAITDFNCYGILISYPEHITLNRCYNKNNPTFVMSRPSQFVGLGEFSSGIVQASVKVGVARRFQVMAFKVPLGLTGGVCPSTLQSWDTFKDYMSHPYILGETTRNILPVGVIDVGINVSYPTIPAIAKVGTCIGYIPNISKDIFTPNKIPGLRLWLDAFSNSNLRAEDSGLGIVLAGDPVGMWINKGDSTVTVTATNSVFRPTFMLSAINGRPALSFDGTSDFFVTDLAPESLSTTFVVFKPVVNIINVALIGSYDGTYYAVLGTDGSGNLWGSVGTGSTVSSTASLTLGANYIATLNADSAGTVELFSNNISQGTAAAAAISSNDFFVGARSNSGTPGNFFRGLIGEIIYYDSVLSPAERLKVFAYLKIKWGL